MSKRFRKLSHTLYECKYHVVFCPKYRYRIFREGWPSTRASRSTSCCGGRRRWGLGVERASRPRPLGAVDTAEVRRLGPDGLPEGEAGDAAVPAVQAVRAAVLGTLPVGARVLCEHGGSERGADTGVRAVAGEEGARDGVATGEAVRGARGVGQRARLLGRDKFQATASGGGS